METERLMHHVQDSMVWGKRLFELMKGPNFTLLAFRDEAINAIRRINWPENGAALCKYLIGKYNDEQHIADTNEQLEKIYGITQSTTNPTRWLYRGNYHE